MSSPEKKDLNQEQPPEERRKKRSFSRLFITITSVLVFFSVLAGFAFGHYATDLPWIKYTGLRNITDTDTRIALLEQRIEALEKGKTLLPSPAEKTETTQALPLDLQTLQSTLAAFSMSLKELDTKLQESSQTTKIVETRAQTGLATVLAFVQMQKAALSGLPFEKERIVMRTLVDEQDTALSQPLTELENYALKGVTPLSQLYKEWQEISPKAEAALREAAAKTWQDRLVVAVENLVSIRSLKPQAGSSLSLESIDLDLSQLRLAEAVKKAAALPDKVLPVIEPWLLKAEARLRADELLSNIATSMIGKEAEKKEEEQEQEQIEESDKEGAPL
jgi:hypothetical protein